MSVGIGKRLKQIHCTGSNYVEVSTDVGSSWVASKVKNIIIKEFANIAVEYRCGDGVVCGVSVAAGCSRGRRQMSFLREC